jgi:hypothetical protein
MILKIFMSDKVENMSCPMVNDVSNEHTACHILGTRHSYYPRRMVLWAVRLCSEYHRTKHFRTNQTTFNFKDT